MYQLMHHECFTPPPGLEHPRGWNAVSTVSPRLRNRAIWDPRFRSWIVASELCYMRYMDIQDCWTNRRMRNSTSPCEPEKHRANIWGNKWMVDMERRMHISKELNWLWKLHESSWVRGLFGSQIFFTASTWSQGTYRWSHIINRRDLILIWCTLLNLSWMKHIQVPQSWPPAILTTKLADSLVASEFPLHRILQWPTVICTFPIG